MFESEVLSLALPPLQRGNKQPGPIVFSNDFIHFCLNRQSFGFPSEQFVSTFSAVADGMLRSLPKVALTFSTLFFFVSLIFEFSASAVAALKSVVFTVV